MQSVFKQSIAIIVFHLVCGTTHVLKRDSDSSNSTHEFTTSETRSFSNTTGAEFREEVAISEPTATYFQTVVTLAEFQTSISSENRTASKFSSRPSTDSKKVTTASPSYEYNQTIEQPLVLQIEKPLADAKKIEDDSHWLTTLSATENEYTNKTNANGTANNVHFSVPSHGSKAASDYKINPNLNGENKSIFDSKNQKSLTTVFESLASEHSGISVTQKSKTGSNIKMFADRPFTTPLSPQKITIPAPSPKPMKKLKPSPLKATTATTMVPKIEKNNLQNSKLSVTKAYTTHKYNADNEKNNIASSASKEKNLVTKPKPLTSKPVISEPKYGKDHSSSVSFVSNIDSAAKYNAIDRVYKKPNSTYTSITSKPIAKISGTLIERKPESFLKETTQETATSISNWDPKCDGLIPSYKPIITNGSYFVRNYPVSAWLSSNVITNNRLLAELEARNKLQKYFEGDNEKGIHLNQTCPVLTQIKFKGAFSDSREKVDEYAVSFYLPWNGSSDIPSPNDSEVLVDVVEERTIYVHPFQARVWEMTDSFLQSEARKLTIELRRKGEPFLSKYFYVASYAKSPTSDNFSNYEIWVYATRFRPHDTVSMRLPTVSQPLTEVTRRTRARVCKGFECPSFEVLAIYKAGIQKRRYFNARFATHIPEFCSFTKAGIWRAFMPLHLYKHGVNSHFEIIGATRPAGIVHVKGGSNRVDGNGTKVACNQTFSVSLYLPKRLHAAPPVTGPTAPRIKITELDDVIVYVQSVGGFLLVPERIQREVTLFRLRLHEQQLCFRDNEYYLVVYDYITRFHGRLNEIWAVADRCPDSL